MEQLLVGVELGGTKVVIAVAASADGEMKRFSFPTTTGAETMAAIVEIIQREAPLVTAIGVASFGPIQIDPGQPGWGDMQATPKPGWIGTEVTGILHRVFPKAEIRLETDVNAAALAEGIWGAGQGCRSFAYFTVGTGIGGGVVADGRLLRGSSHPEIGHLKIPRVEGDTFAGCCPFHGDCFEGLASGTAVRERWQLRGNDMQPNHHAWDMEAEYLALGSLSVVAITRPQRIIIGGGVSQVDGLVGRVHERLQKHMAGYFGEVLVVRAALDQDAGVRGALLLAAGRDAL